MHLRYHSTALVLHALLLLSSCSNNMQEQTKEFAFPESLTIEKILGVTWKADLHGMKIIDPLDMKTLPDSLRQLHVIKEKMFNSILFTKTGEVYVTYAKREDRDLKNSLFFYEGKWIVNKANKEELFVKFNSPVGPLECRLKVGKFSLLNNILVLEAFFLNPDYAFSILFSGKGQQEEYWSKETDVTDPSWTDRNRVSSDPVQYSDMVGAYQVSLNDWKRVVHIDDIKDNVYPLLSTYRLIFEANGNVRLNRLPLISFGSVSYEGVWKIEENRVLIDFPLFPFFGNIRKYTGVFEVDYNPLLGGPKYARHNAGIVMEIVKSDRDKILVKFTELGLCSAYVYLNRI